MRHEGYTYDMQPLLQTANGELKETERRCAIYRGENVDLTYFSMQTFRLPQCTFFLNSSKWTKEEATCSPTGQICKTRLDQV